ncbi:pirin family protein [Providencia rettgeri]|uniref:Pirin family protein n=1 Tax=Providencia rettgeri TaxID=587 RepID=A0AAP2K2M7_PRORE|nr:MULTISPECIES: pirin family protein [Providencia]EJD6509582.1 pirin family protein [Providencia rettgeri]ELR5135270.1 pirin family protein [Providencia rettgeri]ELR5202248.1 pirin family protein [Providencia rettgeri]MBQ0211420.1 pirin family protein [Providencia rettgeri]MBQ0316606.1 pirin family protein [Providencia rettgeri]
MKKIIGIYQSPRSHWVGDGFPVRSMFTYDNHGKYLNPFLLLDRAGPFSFPSSEAKNRGVGEHPHRGFETVTIVYDGEVAHHDSTGEGGVIGPGDVQWMTAASGILHQEYQSDAFMKKGGTLDMVQLWVNLPAKDKSAAPGYQLLESQTMPKVTLPNEAGTLRVIAGDYLGHKGAAKTYTPLDVWDLQLNQGKTVGIQTKSGRNVGLVMLRGSIFVDGRSALNEGELMILDNTESNIVLEATEDALVLLLSGDPIDEPVVGYGPFVMNSMDEINKAVNDFNSGKFGRIPETQ